jgi:hypothetical protein
MVDAHISSTFSKVTEGKIVAPILVRSKYNLISRRRLAAYNKAVEGSESPDRYNLRTKGVNSVRVSNMKERIS